MWTAGDGQPLFFAFMANCPSFPPLAEGVVDRTGVNIRRCLNLSITRPTERTTGSINHNRYLICAQRAFGVAERVLAVGLAAPLGMTGLRYVTHCDRRAPAVQRSQPFRLRCA
jgi:hypothetical protein